MGVLEGFVTGDQRHAHAAQIYSDADALAEAVAMYLSVGFDAGEPAAVVAAPDHLVLIEQRLEAHGWGTARIEDRGLLTTADADATLRAICIDGELSKDAFESVVGGLLDQISRRFPGKNVRVFGEMVNLLCERGEIPVAVELEDLWNGLNRRKQFSLLCGYHLDIFDRQAQLTVVSHVCRQHSHVATGPDDARFADAVQGSLDETLGSSRTGQVYALVGNQSSHKTIPLTQLALSWLSSNSPALAERILARAAVRYRALSGDVTA